MHTDFDDEYEPDHDRYLDSGEDLDEIFADELDDFGSASRDSNNAQDNPDQDEADDEEFHSGLDDDF